MDPWLILLLVVGALFALMLCIWAFTGAVVLFAWAAQQGFVGVAVYVACWIFLFPVMLVACIVVGIYTLWAN